MLIAEYSYETDIKVQRREAYREGLAEGIEQGSEQTKIKTAKEALKNNISIETTAKITGLSIASVEKLKVEIEQNLQ